MVVEVGSSSAGNRVLAGRKSGLPYQGYLSGHPLPPLFFPHPWQAHGHLPPDPPQDQQHTGPRAPARHATFRASLRRWPEAGPRRPEIRSSPAGNRLFHTGGWPSADDGPYAWGYCFIRENDRQTQCSSDQWPCPAGMQYYGRGPIQLTHNYNYGLAGQAISVDLINNPDLVATNPVISFKTAIWFWMTPQANKPSSHDVIIRQWGSSDADRAANRVPGYGVITNIINGGLECGSGANDKVADRIGFYKRYCDLLGVSYGDNLDCYNQRPFA
ncbi:CHITINASE (CLASS IB) / HEVEIN [Salix koriyanagi]|uniref:chitinase n=1 Tax=Salix koriyanagi TaxID=2511006 RepID=A0A9Q0UNL8_9ROSI|nr:CHITINASE (CLASS IB) / HEVEIN [Salix koriyanagi]